MSATSRPSPPFSLLSVAQVAQRLVVSTKSVRRLIDRGELPVHRIGNLLRISEVDLELFLRARRETKSPSFAV